MRKENYLQVSHKLKMYSKGSKYFNNVKLLIDHVDNKIRIGGNLIDINTLIMTEYHGCKFPITPYLLCSFEYDYTHLRRYYAEYGQKSERLFFKETLGKGAYATSEYFDVGDYDLKLIKDLDMLENRYKILETVVIPNGNKNRTERLMAICSKYYLIDNQVNLVTVMLNAMYTIFRALSFNKQDIFGTYFKIDDFIEYRSKLDVSFDDSITICQGLMIDWAINIFKKYLKGKQLKDIETVINKYDIDTTLSAAFKPRSKFKKYLEGKITVAELVESRNRHYKTRKSDYACEAMSMWTDSFKIKEFTNFFEEDMLEAIIEREVKTNGRRAITNLLCAKNWLTRQFELAHGYEDLAKENDNLGVKLRETEKRNNSIDKAIKKRENRITVLEDKLKQLDIKYKDSVLRDDYNKLKNELAETKTALIESNSKLAKTEKDLVEKVKQFSDTSKEYKKNKAKLEMYIDLFGDISEKQEINEVVESLSIQEKIDALDGLDIVLCGGSIEMENYFEKLGLKVFQVLELNDSTFKKKFDILIVVTDMVSHQMVYKAKKQANAIGAMCVYVQGTNKEKIIDLLYSRLMTESS